MSLIARMLHKALQRIRGGDIAVLSVCAVEKINIKIYNCAYSGLV